MNLYRRTRRVLASEGIKGLVRRAVLKSLGPPPPAAPPDRLAPLIAELNAQIPELRAAYDRHAAEFPARVQALGLGDVSRYYWYHTIDLGNGLVTPGDYDYRADVPRFQFPEDLRGRRVLDVGSATGFFAFALERRGAEVVSVELPSLAAWDMPLDGQAERTIEALRQYHQAATAEETYHLHLDGPFRFCHRALRSSVRRCYSSIYDLTPEVLGCDGFDLIFLGDILLHLMSPLKALAVLAPLCRGTMVITQQLPDEEYPTPQALFVGADPTDGGRAWWMPNLACLQQMLQRLGFRDVRVVGHFAGVVRRAWGLYYRAIIHAHK